MAQSIRNEKLTLFIPSPASRFFPQVRSFLHSCGIPFQAKGRELYVENEHLDIYMSRGFDIPQAIGFGWGDVGITGLDACAEAEADSQIQILGTLGLRFSEIVLASAKLESIEELSPKAIVVCEYFRLAEKYFSRIGRSDLNLVYVTGAAEAFGRHPEVAAIVVLRTSGQTLKDNNLRVLDTIFKTQACLISNRSIYSMKREKIAEFMNTLKIERDGCDQREDH